MGELTQCFCMLLSWLPNVVSSETAPAGFDPYRAVFIQAMRFSFSNESIQHLNQLKVLLSTASFGKELRRSPKHL